MHHCPIERLSLCLHGTIVIIVISGAFSVRTAVNIRGNLLNSLPLLGIKRRYIQKPPSFSFRHLIEPFLFHLFKRLFRIISRIDGFFIDHQENTHMVIRFVVWIMLCLESAILIGVAQLSWVTNI